MIGMFDHIKPKAANKYIGVTGTSVINHRSRMKLGLSCDQYVMMQFIDQNADKKDHYQIKEEPIWRDTGFTFEEAVILIQKLCFKKYITLLGSEYQITKLWRVMNPKQDDIFENIWVLLKRKGNKKKALDNYKKALENISATELLDKAKKYAQHHQEEETPFRFLHNVENWLNPQVEIYNEIIHEDTKPTNITRGKL